MTEAAIDARSYLANDDQLAMATIHTVAEGPAAGSRVLLVQPSGGLHSRILLDRGLDLGTTWYQGVPLSWTSARGERGGGWTDAGQGWHLGWAGGLVTTCGLLNVGEPSEGHGQHGRYTDQPAEDVRVSRIGAPGAPESVVVTATIRETDALGRGLVLRRTLTFAVGRAELGIRDATSNESAESLQAPILYHINFGYPFLRPESRTIGSIRSSTRIHGVGGDFAAAMGAPRQHDDEVFEHDIRDDNGWAQIDLTGGEAASTTATVRWRTDGLPRVHTWRRRQPGSYVQAIEPANSSVAGREADRATGGAPLLEPGQERITEIAVSVR